MAKSAKEYTQGIFNNFCRFRDTKGVGANCISCGVWKAHEDLQGGHFIPTTSSAIRFDERNVNAQCLRCNMYLGGNSRHYLKGMVAKYGQEVVDELEAREFESKRWPDWELKEIRKTYRAKTKELQND